MNITSTFRLHGDTLPTEAQQLQELWRVANLLVPLGLPLNGWYPPADTPEHSLLNEAFDGVGPTPAAVSILQAQNQEKEMPGWREAAVWNGKEGPGGALFRSSLTTASKPFRCSFELSTKRIDSFSNKELVLPLVLSLLEIWPAMTLEVHPYKYGTMQQVFPDRPGVGWMLYLPKVLTVQEVPEAGALIPVLGEKKKQTGTIIVSVADEPFSSDNPEHVRIANKIEVRLVDQDLLPRYADL